MPSKEEILRKKRKYNKMGIRYMPIDDTALNRHNFTYNTPSEHSAFGPPSWHQEVGELEASAMYHSTIGSGEADLSGLSARHVSANRAVMKIGDETTKLDDLAAPAINKLKGESSTVIENVYEKMENIGRGDLLFSPFDITRQTGDVEYMLSQAGEGYNQTPIEERFALRGNSVYEVMNIGQFQKDGDDYISLNLYDPVNDRYSTITRNKKTEIADFVKNNLYKVDMNSNYATQLQQINREVQYASMIERFAGPIKTGSRLQEKSGRALARDAYQIALEMNQYDRTVQDVMSNASSFERGFLTRTKDRLAREAPYMLEVLETIEGAGDLNARQKDVAWNRFLSEAGFFANKTNTKRPFHLAHSVRVSDRVGRRQVAVDLFSPQKAQDQLMSLINRNSQHHNPVTKQKLKKHRFLSVANELREKGNLTDSQFAEIKHGDYETLADRVKLMTDMLRERSGADPNFFRQSLDNPVNLIVDAPNMPSGNRELSTGYVVSKDRGANNYKNLVNDIINSTKSNIEVGKAIAEGNYKKILESNSPLTQVTTAMSAFRKRNGIHDVNYGAGYSQIFATGSSRNLKVATDHMASVTHPGRMMFGGSGILGKLGVLKWDDNNRGYTQDGFGTSVVMTDPKDATKGVYAAIYDLNNKDAFDMASARGVVDPAVAARVEVPVMDDQGILHYRGKKFNMRRVINRNYHGQDAYTWAMEDQYSKIKGEIQKVRNKAYEALREGDLERAESIFNSAVRKSVFELPSASEGQLTYGDWIKQREIDVAPLMSGYKDGEMEEMVTGLNYHEKTQAIRDKLPQAINELFNANDNVLNTNLLMTKEDLQMTQYGNYNGLRTLLVGDDDPAELMPFGVFGKRGRPNYIQWNNYHVLSDEMINRLKQSSEFSRAAPRLTTELAHSLAGKKGSYLGQHITGVSTKVALADSRTIQDQIDKILADPNQSEHLKNRVENLFGLTYEQQGMVRKSFMDSFSDLTDSQGNKVIKDHGTKILVNGEKATLNAVDDDIYDMLFGKDVQMVYNTELGKHEDFFQPIAGQFEKTIDAMERQGMSMDEIAQDINKTFGVDVSVGENSMGEQSIVIPNRWQEKDLKIQDIRDWMTKHNVTQQERIGSVGGGFDALTMVSEIRFADVNTKFGFSDQHGKGKGLKITQKEIQAMELQQSSVISEFLQDEITESLTGDKKRRFKGDIGAMRWIMEAERDDRGRLLPDPDKPIRTLDEFNPINRVVRSEGLFHEEDLRDTLISPGDDESFFLELPETAKINVGNKTQKDIRRVNHLPIVPGHHVEANDEGLRTLDKIGDSLRWIDDAARDLQEAKKVGDPASIKSARKRYNSIIGNYFNTVNKYMVGSTDGAYEQVMSKRMPSSTTGILRIAAPGTPYQKKFMTKDGLHHNTVVVSKQRVLDMYGDDAEDALRKMDAGEMYGLGIRFPTIHHESMHGMRVMYDENLADDAMVVSAGTAKMWAGDADGDIAMLMMAHGKGFKAGNERLARLQDAIKKNVESRALESSIVERWMEADIIEEQEKGNWTWKRMQEATEDSKILQDGVFKNRKLAEQASEDYVAKLGKEPLGQISNISTNMRAFTEVIANLTEENEATKQRKVKMVEEFGRIGEQKIISAKHSGDTSDKIFSHKLYEIYDQISTGELDPEKIYENNEYAEVLDFLDSSKRPDVGIIQSEMVRRGDYTQEAAERTLRGLAQDSSDEATMKLAELAEEYGRYDTKEMLDVVGEMARKINAFHDNGKGTTGKAFRGVGSVAEGYNLLTMDERTLRDQAPTRFIEAIAKATGQEDRVEEMQERFVNTYASALEGRAFERRAYEEASEQATKQTGEAGRKVASEFDFEKFVDDVDWKKAGIIAGVAGAGVLAAQILKPRDTGSSPEQMPRHDEAPATDGKYRPTPRASTGQRKTYVTPNKPSQGYKVKVSGRNVENNLSPQQIGQMINQGVNEMTPVPLNVNMNVRDDTQQLNQASVRELIANAIT